MNILELVGVSLTLAQIPLSVPYVIRRWLKKPPFLKTMDRIIVTDPDGGNLIPVRVVCIFGNVGDHDVIIDCHRIKRETK